MLYTFNIHQLTHLPLKQSHHRTRSTVSLGISSPMTFNKRETLRVGKTESARLLNELLNNHLPQSYYCITTLL
jgi:hypothetical protein